MHCICFLFAAVERVRTATKMYASLYDPRDPVGWIGGLLPRAVHMNTSKAPLVGEEFDIQVYGHLLNTTDGLQGYIVPAPPPAPSQWRRRLVPARLRAPGRRCRRRQYRP